MAIFLTVSNISSKGAMAANSKSFEKNRVVKIKMIQTNIVRAIFMMESRELLLLLSKPISQS